MANFFDMFKLQKNNKKTLPVIFVVDSSGSMAGEKMLRINRSIRTVIGRFADYNKNEVNDYNVKIAVLKFSSGSQWVTCGLEDPARLEIPLIPCGGVTDLGSALAELNRKLSRKEFFSDAVSYAAPFICVVSDGTPTDNYVVSLEELKENNWYKTSNKVAIAIGEDADSGVLSNVVGSLDSVIHLNSVTFLEQIITGITAFLFDSSVSITSTAQPVKTLTIASNQEFDSDHVCYSRIDSLNHEFDSDCVCETCVLGDDTKNEFDSDEVANTLSSWDDYNWEDSDWGDSEKSSAIVLDDVAEWRKKLAEALQRGEPVVVDFGNEVKGKHYNSSMSAIQVPDGKLAGGGNPCPSCNNIVMTGFKFCPQCGTPIQSNASSKVNVSQVQFSAVVPKRFIKGEYAMIDISVYEEIYRNIVDRIIANADDEVREVVAGSQEIADNTKIRIKLSSPDIDVADCEETQKWQGRYLTFSFPVEIPRNYAKKQILFIAMVYFNDLIATKLKFVANCTSVREQKIQLTREDVLTAFISYASQDRSRVATIIQGMQKARPDMDIFFDVENLRSGEEWERVLQREIENRDVLFLCWSNFAKNSEWVEKEWRYALTNKGLDSIEPVPLVSPIECPPPEELKSKHFNDRALLYKDL